MLEVAGDGSTSPGYHNASIIDNIAIGHKIEEGVRINYVHSSDNVPLALQTTQFPNAIAIRDDLKAIGIGTANPIQLLTLQRNTGDVGITFRQANVGMSYSMGIDDADNQKFKLGLGGRFIRPALTLDLAENFGIGTTSPGAKLDVVGKIRCTTLELTSDENVKQGIEPVSAAAVLAKVAKLPITTWAYTNSPAVRHLGPMAQAIQSRFQPRRR